MKKVLYITDQIYRHGGGERVLTNKANYLVNNGYEVGVLTSEQKNNPPCYDLDDKVKLFDLGINYNRKVSYFKWTNFKKLPTHFSKLSKSVKSFNPDIIVTLSTQFDFYFLPFVAKKALTIKEFHSSRHFQWIARQRSTSKLKRVFFKFNDWIEKKYHHLAVLTEDEKNYFSTGNVVVVPNAISYYPEFPAKLEEKTVIAAGRIAPVKQFDKLVVAWGDVVKRFPDWILKIYGDGEKYDLELLKNKIKELKLNDSVYLMGNTDDLQSKLLSSSIYALSSKTECFPMVLLESLSCGLPIVSFDCPNGPRNIIKNNMDGILVEDQNVTALAKGIEQLIAEEGLRKKMGKTARQNIKRFSTEKVMKTWENLFDQDKPQS